jgi:hypothetical protein
VKSHPVFSLAQAFTPGGVSAKKISFSARFRDCLPLFDSSASKNGLTSLECFDAD